MKLVAFADTHGFHEGLEIPDGDILVFAGDMCMRGEVDEVASFANWFNKLPHRHKIIIAGNHDWAFQKETSLCVGMFDAIYMQDDEYVIDGIRIWGSPWTPEFCGWAFMLNRGDDIKAKWDLIPDGIDVLVTHGPMMGMLDKTWDEHAGCYNLRDAISEKKPRYHLFGHIHEGYGKDDNKHTVFANVSLLDGHYGYNNREPMVFDIC